MLYLERELEDNECVEEIYTHWARDSNNQFLFRRNNLKYEIFTDPIVSSWYSYSVDTTCHLKIATVDIMSSHNLFTAQS